MDAYMVMCCCIKLLEASSIQRSSVHRQMVIKHSKNDRMQFVNYLRIKLNSSNRALPFCFATTCM